jgi:hypothetical protein
LLEADVAKDFLADVVAQCFQAKKGKQLPPLG